MNFCTTKFDKMLEIRSFPAGWVICNEDGLPMYLHIGISSSEEKMEKFINIY